MLGAADENTVGKWREKLQNQFEHRETAGASRGLWIFAPLWLEAFYAKRTGPAPTGEKKSAKAIREAFQAEREGLLVEKLRRELDDGWVSREDHIGDFRAIGMCLRSKAEDMCPDCRELQDEALDEALQMIEKRYVDGIGKGSIETEASES